MVPVCCGDIFWSVIVADSDHSMPVWLFPVAGLMATSVWILESNQTKADSSHVAVSYAPSIRTISGWLNGKEEWPRLLFSN